MTLFVLLQPINSVIALMDGSRGKNIIIFVLLCVLAQVAEALCQMQSVRGALQIGLLPPIFLPANGNVSSPYHFKPDSSFEQSSRIIYEMLAAALRTEESIALAHAETLKIVLRDAPNFNPLVPDSVQRIGRALHVDKLLLPSFEAMEKSSSAAPRLRLQVRWFDAASGEMTKFYTAEFERDSLFNAKAFVRALLDTPELILVQEEQVAPLPALKDLPETVTAQKGSRRWFWYVSTAAFISGGSLYWLLERKNETQAKPLLPEPPGPPPQ